MKTWDNILNISSPAIGYKNAIVFDYGSIEKIVHISGIVCPILSELALRSVSLIAKFNDPPYVISLDTADSHSRFIYVLPQKLNKFVYSFLYSRRSSTFTFKKHQNIRKS